MMLQYVFLALLPLILPVNGLYYSLPSCSNTVRAYEDLFRVHVLPGLSSSNNVFRSFRTSQQDSLCDMERTCCSPNAETAFFLFAVANQKRSILDQVKASGLTSCRNHTIFGETANFFELGRQQLIQDLITLYGVYADGAFQDQFSRLYQYLASSVHSGDVSNLPTEFMQMFLNISLLSFLDNRNSYGLQVTDEFRLCFNNIILEREGERIQKSLLSFQRSYNITLRYFRALRVVDRVVDAVLHLKLSSQCRQALMKMASCAQCAGLPRGAKTCLGLCQNTINGCLTDLSDLVQPIRDFSRALIAMKNVAQSFSVYTQIILIEPQVLSFLNDMITDYSVLASQVNERCPLTYGVPDARPYTPPRQGTHQPLIYPLTALNNSAYCLLDSVNLFSDLLETLCRGPETSSRNENCWNGNRYGSYSVKVVGPTRSEQASNPEVQICTSHRRFSREIRLLRYMTRELNSLTGACSTDDEDCVEVLPTTQYYDLDAIDLSSIDIDPGSGSGQGGSGDEGSDDDSEERPTPAMCNPETIPSY